MPLSKDAQARERQLANLKRGDSPAPAGNQRAVQHGASTPLLVEQRKKRFLAELTEAFPSASQAELSVQATRMARLELLGAYIDQRGVIRNRRTGAVYPAVEREQQIAAAFERQHAILTAREQARPGGPTADSLDDVVAEIMASGASS